MRHVHHEIGADAIGNLAESLEVPEARIGAAAGDDQLRLHLLGLPRDRIHVDDLVFATYSIVRGLEPLARHVDGRAMGEMAAGGEVEAHEGVPWPQQRQKHRLIHLAA